jgi:signal transduction histidine kinase
VVITVIALLGSYGEAHPTTPGAYFTGGHHLPHTPTAALLLVVLGGAALAWRHRYPRTVVCVATAATVAYSLPGYVNGVALLLPAVGLVTIATKFPVRYSVAWALAVTIVLMAATAANNPLGRYSGGFWIVPANDAVALFVGIAIANRTYVHSARMQAARQAAVDAQRRVEEERLRIARELHDSLTHSISVIQVQAGVAVHLTRKRGEEVPPALLAIHEAGADAARELRATLGVLRSQDNDPGPDCDGSGLGQLEGMVSRARSAGLPVTVTVTGAQRPLPPAVDQAAYRIVQEALTNTSRHAGSADGGQASAWVLLHYAKDALTVQVHDDGGGFATTSAGPGLGLMGMRERVSALGGRLHAGPREGGGFQVRAELPVRA